MERSYPTKCKTRWLIIKFLCKKSFKQKIFQRYKDMNLTDWDELNSIDLRTGIATMYAWTMQHGPVSPIFRLLFRETRSLYIIKKIG